ncbi:MAG: FtsX-like permease family protein [Acidobacteriota bacterium]|nr:FtsX-like permease family protein [Acidobacteriota bacterium]MDQ3417876.1 FtsX-like permease family protein [Acidobacteriota bacterium]
MKFLPLIWRNLTRRKIRTIFTTLSIFIAFLLFGFLMAIKAAFNMGIDVAGADRLMTIHKVSFIQPLPKSYQDRISAVEGVTAITHANWFGGIYQDPANFIANFAVDPESYLAMYPEFVMPEDQKQAWFANRTGAIVGIDTARRFGWKVGDRVPLQGTIYRKPDDSPWEFTIDGIYDSPLVGTDKTQFFFHYKYLNETISQNFGRDQVGWYIVKVANPGEADIVAKRMDALFANSPAETKTATEKAFVADFAKQVGDIGAIMTAIAAVVILFILFVAGNAMAQSIRERTNELAILKTLGFNDRKVLGMVLFESTLVAVLGGSLGLGLAWLMIAQGDPTGGLLPIFHFPPKDVVLGIVLVVVLGVLSGMVPALQAGRLKIVDALRRS